MGVASVSMKSMRASGSARVDREVGGAGLEDCEHRDHGVSAASGEQGHASAGSDAALGELLGQAVAVVVEFAVGHTSVSRR